MFKIKSDKSYYFAAIKNITTTKLLNLLNSNAIYSSFVSNIWPILESVFILNPLLPENFFSSIMNHSLR